ncbi:MAG: plasmid stabilization protein [Thiotrichaceae bacterium IS1]|nr:MAG: plasmid stabilization protein [Thiotrichaceae bacterium IS1]
MYSVSLSNQAKAFFEEATASLQKRLDRGFDQLKLTPYRHSHIKPLKGKLAGYYRYRVGDYRVIYRIEALTKPVLINVIVHRSKAYE